jgi:hypothetical protein
MPKIRGEDDKKHGDRLESLIERTGGNPSAQERSDSTDEEESELRPDDEDEALLEDDDDEDVLSDDADDLRDLSEPD